MSDKAFGARIASLLKEHASYGTQLKPVQSASWPDTSAGENSTVVTNGETTPMGQPRVDLQQQANGGELDQECVGEVASLLLSIGYILASKGLVQDKFNVETTISFLSDNFLEDDEGPVGGEAQPEIDVVAAPIPQQLDGGIPAPGSVDPNQQTKDMMQKPKMANMTSSYMESRKLLESKNKNK